MKWFKHQTDLSMDEGVSRYLDEAGPRNRLTAYGFLMLLHEVIASRMNAAEGHLVCTATYSITQWGRITNSHPNRVRKYLGLCGVIEWVQVEFEGSSCRVSIPRMVEWRDETTRKSGVLPEQVAQSRGEETRKDKRESRHDDALSESFQKKSQIRSPPQDFKVSEVLQEWATKHYPTVDIDRETEKFRRYEFSTPRSNWNDAWKTWIQQADEYHKRNSGNTDPVSPNQALLNLGPMMGIVIREDETDSEYCARINDANKRRLDALDA